MTSHRRGFTLIELLIVVVIIGVLAAVAVPKYANTKDRARIAAMKSDLRNLLSQQEGYYVTFGRYAAAIGPTESGATLAFVPGDGNAIALVATVPANGWSATVTRTDLSAATTCGVYVGSEAAPNAVLTNAGAVGCW